MVEDDDDDDDEDDDGSGGKKNGTINVGHVFMVFVLVVIILLY